MRTRPKQCRKHAQHRSLFLTQHRTIHYGRRYCWGHDISRSQAPTPVQPQSFCRTASVTTSLSFWSVSHANSSASPSHDVHCCGRPSFSYIVAKLMHLRNCDFSSYEGMLLEPPFIRRLLGVLMLLGWLLSSRELAALDDNFLGRSTVRFVVQLMYSASTAKGSGV